MSAVNAVRSFIIQTERRLLAHGARRYTLQQLGLHSNEIAPSELDPISQHEVPNFLKSHAIPYKAGYTCISIVCPRLNLMKEKSQSLSATGQDQQLYINATTGRY